MFSTAPIIIARRTARAGPPGPGFGAAAAVSSREMSIIARPPVPYSTGPLPVRQRSAGREGKGRAGPPAADLHAARDGPPRPFHRLGPPHRAPDPVNQLITAGR